MRCVAAGAGELDLVIRTNREKTTGVIYEGTIERDWGQGHSFELFTGEVVAKKNVLFGQRFAGRKDKFVGHEVVADELLESFRGQIALLYPDVCRAHVSLRLHHCRRRTAASN